MRPAPRSLASLVALALAYTSLPARAADLNRLLPDDTNFIVTINVKQILQTPVFVKNQKQIEDLLKQDAVQMVLKGTGFNPLKDIDRLVLCSGTSGHPEEGTFDKQVAMQPGGPVVLAQGRFDQDKIQARFNELAKDMSDTLKIHGIGKADVLEIKSPGFLCFVAVVNPETLVACPRRDQVEDILEKAAGQRQTELKSPGIAKLIGGLDLKQSIQVAAAADMITGSRISSRSENGKTTTTVKLERLGDSGIESLVGGGQAGDKLQGKVTLTAKDADTAKSLADSFEQNLAKIKQEGARRTENPKEFAPILEALNTVKIASKDRTITIEGQIGAEVAQAMFKYWLLAVPPTPVDKDK